MSGDKSKSGTIASLHKDYCRKYSSKTSARAFLKALAGQDHYDFGLQAIYKNLTDEFVRQGKQCVSYSQQNWRWEPKPELHPKNDSMEKTLEKMVVRHPKNKHWTNQVPVASGVFSERADGHRAIDLVCRLNEGSYEFVELKTGSDNPVYAAYEILLYGALYVFYRENAVPCIKKDSEKEILKAKSVMLIVAAPNSYYDGYSHLNKLQKLLSEELSNWSGGMVDGLEMGFRFDCFDHEEPKKIMEKNVTNFFSKESYC